MANSELPGLSTATLADGTIIYVVTDPGGGGEADGKSTLSALATFLAGRSAFTPRLIASGRATRASTSLTLNSATWANVDTALDLVLTAATGDIVRAGLSGLHANDAAVNQYLDVATIVSAAPVNYIGGDGGASSRGVVAWEGESSTATPIGGTVEKALVSGDISGGTVTLRLRYRQSSASARTLFATSDIRLHWWAEVYRPA